MDVSQAGRSGADKRTTHGEKGILALLSLLAVLVCLVLGISVVAYVFFGASVAEVRIASPAHGWIVVAGESVIVHAVSTGRGLIRSELLVDGIVVDSIPSPGVTELTDWSISHSWVAQPQGQHRVSVRVSDISGEAIESQSVVVAVAPPGRIAFSSNRTGSYEIYTMRTDGGDVLRLTRGEGQNREPSCGRAGSLLYTSSAVGGGSDVWLVEHESDEGSNLTASLGGDHSPRWSPDDESIAFISDRYGHSQLFLMNADGSGQFQLTRREFPVEQPSWAHDTTALLFASDEDDNWDIFVLSVEGQSTTRLTDDHGQDWQPAWSPRGDEIAYTSNREGSQQIYIMNADGSEQRRITAFPLGAEQPLWSPGGEWIVCVAYTGSGERIDAREIYLIRRDGSDQMRLTENAFDDTEPTWCQ